MRPHSRYRTTMLNGLIQRLILIYVFSIHETIATIQGKARSQITIEGYVNTFDLRFIDIRTHLYLIIVRTMGGVISIPFRRIQHLIVNHATYVIHKSGHGQREIPHRIFCAQRKIVALLRVQIRITDRKASRSGRFLLRFRIQLFQFRCTETSRIRSAEIKTAYLIQQSHVRSRITLKILMVNIAQTRVRLEMLIDIDLVLSIKRSRVHTFTRYVIRLTAQ